MRMRLLLECNDYDDDINDDDDSVVAAYYDAKIKSQTQRPKKRLTMADYLGFSDLNFYRKSY